MRVVCAPDSFKESMTAAVAAAAMARGVRAVRPDADVVERPLADGGEGLLDAVAGSLGAELREAGVRDALGRPIRARFALAGPVAIVEVAQAIGLGSLAPAERDVMAATSAGVGDLVAAALDAGATRLVIGLGGSATNDGGAGMLDALGARFLDASGTVVRPTPADLAHVASVDLTGLDPRLAGVAIDVACDVTAPLHGPDGASATFGPQKGASPAQVAALDRALAHLASVTGTDAHADAPGAGAAGGLGWALVACLGATLRSGIDLVADLTGLDDLIAGADLVLTGEGSVDAQTLLGKTVAGVTRLAARHGVRVVVMAGRVAPDADALLAEGVTALVPIVAGPCDLPTALAQGEANLERATATAVRLIVAGAPER